MITGNEMAFPVPHSVSGIGTEDYYESGGNPGLTIRQHFAGMAIPALISNPIIQLNTTITIEDVAIEAVEYADALIKELNKQP